MTITEPAQGQIGGLGPSFSVMVAGTATDESRITTVQYRVGNVGTYKPVDKVSGDNNNWDWRKDITGLSLGTHTINIQAIDQYNNTRDAKKTITFVDTGPPVCLITSPGVSPHKITWAEGGVSLDFAGTASDPTSNVQVVEWRLNGSPWANAINSFRKLGKLAIYRGFSVTGFA